MTGAEQERRHRQRMQRKKAVVDASIANADRDQGVVVVLTGNGKGKSSSAFGMVARSLGHGMQAAVAQFIKGRSDTGEEAFFRAAGVRWRVLGEGFTWETQNLNRDRETAQRGWSQVQEWLREPDLNLVVLDELTYVIKYGWLELETVLEDLAERPPMQHVIITGRAAPTALCEAADTVSVLEDRRHALRAGIRAQRGVDL